MLNVSIVLYQPSWEQVLALTQSLLEYTHVRHVFWVDNSPNRIDTLPLQSERVRYIFNGKNLAMVLRTTLLFARVFTMTFLFT